MKLTILAVGKVKEKFYQQGIAEFTKRLSRYCKLEIKEMPDERTPDCASKAEMLKIKETEGNRLLAHIRDTDYVCALAIEGKALSSQELAQHLNQLGIQGKSSIVFVIGGSLGLHPKVLARADFLLSFSRMTFPHQLMRVILLEQIYRSYRIIHGEPYHK